MRLKYALQTAVAYAAFTSASLAATQQEADLIKASFQKYLSSAPGVVTVSIDGDTYKLTIDAAPIIKKVQGPEFKMELSPISYALKPLGGDRWEVNASQPIEVKLDAKPVLSGLYAMKKYTHTGIYNTAMRAFESQEYAMTDFMMKQSVDDKELKQDDNMEIESLAGKATAKTNSKGGIDSASQFEVINQRSSQVVETKPDSPIPFKLAIDVNTPNQESNTSAINIKSREILDLVAFFVANNSSEAIVTNQEQLRSLAKSALPLFDSLSSSVVVGKTNFKTNYGDGSVDSVTYAIDLAGAVEKGKFSQDMVIAGLQIPATALPPWALSLIPKDVALGFAIEGYNGAEVAKLLVEEFDLKSEPPLNADTQAKLFGYALPQGALSVTIKPGNVKSQLYNLTYEGTVEIRPSASPLAKCKVKFTGFQGTMEALQKASQSDPSVNQVIGPMLAAQGFAKQEGDTLIWNIEATREGAFLVNGVDLSKMGGP
jgi:Cu/Ag efflux protein CusF